MLEVTLVALNEENVFVKVNTKEGESTRKSGYFYDTGNRLYRVDGGVNYFYYRDCGGRDGVMIRNIGQPFDMFERMCELSTKIKEEMGEGVEFIYHDMRNETNFVLSLGERFIIKNANPELPNLDSFNQVGRSALDRIRNMKESGLYNLYTI